MKRAKAKLNGRIRGERHWNWVAREEACMNGKRSRRTFDRDTYLMLRERERIMNELLLEYEGDEL